MFCWPIGVFEFLPTQKRAGARLYAPPAERPRVPNSPYPCNNRSTVPLGRLGSRNLRAIQRILAVVKKNFEDGKYKNDVEAEADFRQMVDRDEGCK